MKKTLVSFGALALVGMAGAAGFAEEYPDAQKTLPASMGWMQGFPPAQEKTLHASDGSFFEFPALRYSKSYEGILSDTQCFFWKRQKVFGEAKT